MTPVSDVDLLLGYVVLAGAWIGPIGLFVLRRRLAGATGGGALVKAGLYVISVLSAPLVLLTTGIVVAAGVEGAGLMWDLWKMVW